MQTLKTYVEGVLNETGEMGQHDIEEGGEDYEWAQAIEKAAKAIESETEGKLKFDRMRPFDKYQGPYATITVNGRGDKLWSISDEGEEGDFYIDNAEMRGTVEELSAALNGDKEAMKTAKERGKKK